MAKTFVMEINEEQVELYPCNIRALHDLIREFPDTEKKTLPDGKVENVLKVYDENKENYDRADAIKPKLKELLEKFVHKGDLDTIVNAITADNKVLGEFLYGVFEPVGDSYKQSKEGYLNFCRKPILRLVK